MEELPQHPTRRRIYERVRDRPGIGARDLQRALGLGWGETAHHLRTLTDAGVLRRERGGRRDYYFLPEITWEDRKTLSLLRSTTERRILVTLAGAQSLTFPEVVERVGLSKSTVSFHMHHMIDLGVLEVVRKENVPHYQPRDPARLAELLKRYGESFEDRLVDQFVSVWSGLFRE